MNESARRHRLKTLHDLEAFMSGDKPTFFSVAEFVYVYCKMRNRNRWGYSRVVADLKDILKYTGFGSALCRSYFFTTSFLSMEDIILVHENIANRHAAVTFLLMATSGFRANHLTTLKISDFNIDTFVLGGSVKLPKFVGIKLCEYIKRNISNGATQSSYLIANHTIHGTSYDTSSIERINRDTSNYRRNINKSRLETGINPNIHIKAMAQGKIFPNGAIVRYCQRPGRRE